MSTLVEQIIEHAQISRDVAGLVGEYSFEFKEEAKKNGFFASLDMLLKINHSIQILGIEKDSKADINKRYYYLYFKYGENVYTFLNDIGEISELKLPFATNYYFYGPRTTFPNIEFYEEEEKGGVTIDLIGLTGLINLNKFNFKAFKSTLNTIYLGNVTKIDNNCFIGFNNLETIDLGKVTEIGKECFAKCIALKTINLEKVKTIGFGCFSNCLFTEIDLRSVIDIGDSCFINCASLKTVTWSKTIETISSFTFNGCPLEIINHFKNITYKRDCITFVKLNDDGSEVRNTPCSVMGGKMGKKKSQPYLKKSKKKSIKKSGKNSTKKVGKKTAKTGKSGEKAGSQKKSKKKSQPYLKKAKRKANQTF